MEETCKHCVDLLMGKQRCEMPCSQNSANHQGRDQFLKLANIAERLSCSDVSDGHGTSRRCGDKIVIRDVPFERRQKYLLRSEREAFKKTVQEGLFTREA